MAFLLVIYWLVSILAEVTQLLNILELFPNRDITDLVDVMKFDLIVVRLIFYSFLFLLDINVIRTKVRKVFSYIYLISITAHHLFQIVV